MAFRRFTALLLTAALAQLSLGATPDCASHGVQAAMPDMSVMDHASMPAGDAAPAESAECDGGAPAQTQQPPCDHQGMAETCASMTSCASSSAEVQSLALSFEGQADGIVVVTTEAFHGATVAPEPPPPRV